MTNLEIIKKLLATMSENEMKMLSGKERVFLMKQLIAEESETFEDYSEPSISDVSVDDFEEGPETEILREEDFEDAELEMEEEEEESD